MYHNPPYAKVVLDDGSWCKVSKSVLNGQPTLAVVNHGTVTNLPIHNCPFCGAALPATMFKPKPVPGMSIPKVLTVQDANWQAQNGGVYSAYDVKSLLDAMSQLQGKLNTYHPEV